MGLACIPVDLLAEILLLVASEYPQLTLVSKLWAKAAQWSLPLAIRLRWAKKLILPGLAAESYVKFAKNWASIKPNIAKGELDLFRFFYELEKPRNELPTPEVMSAGLKESSIYPVYTLGSVAISFEEVMEHFGSTTMPQLPVDCLKALHKCGKVVACYRREDFSLAGFEQVGKKIHAAAYDIVVKETYQTETGGEEASGSGVGEATADCDDGKRCIAQSSAKVDVTFKEGEARYWVYGIHVVFGTIRPSPYPRGAWNPGPQLSLFGSRLRKQYTEGQLTAEQAHKAMKDIAVKSVPWESTPASQELCNKIPVLASPEWHKWIKEGNKPEEVAEGVLDGDVEMEDPNMVRQQILAMLVQAGALQGQQAP
eukprot:TRINITY_DN35762_c0_g1_i1.p1 TRINITY_DN35762_c0_g1~~TRINITY_DN35762_c0_g1_i1.p1  ORF type:complete len:384 (+),score=32.49 TRINITY_DN35762_c0_g1_i1:48-1154(+)